LKIGGLHIIRSANTCRRSNEFGDGNVSGGNNGIFSNAGNEWSYREALGGQEFRDPGYGINGVPVEIDTRSNVAVVAV
jgi:hypothetical protein